MNNCEKKDCESSAEAKIGKTSASVIKELGSYTNVCTADGNIPMLDTLDVARRDITVPKLLEAVKASGEAPEDTDPVWFTKSVRTIVSSYKEGDDGFRYVYECLAAEPDMCDALLWLFERPWNKEAGPLPAFCMDCSETIPRNGQTRVNCPKCGKAIHISDVLFISNSDALHEVMQVLMLTKRIQELSDAGDWDTAENTLFVLPSLCTEPALWTLSLLNDFIDHSDKEGHCLSLCSLPDSCLDQEYTETHGFGLTLRGLRIRPNSCPYDLVNGNRLFAFFLPLSKKLGGSDVLFRMLLPLRAKQVDMQDENDMCSKPKPIKTLKLPKTRRRIIMLNEAMEKLFEIAEKSATLRINRQEPELYDKTENKKYTLEQELEAQLSEDDRKLAFAYADVCHEQDSLFVKHAFMEGVKVGAQLLLDVSRESCGILFDTTAWLQEDKGAAELQEELV